MEFCSATVEATEGSASEIAGQKWSETEKGATPAGRVGPSMFVNVAGRSFSRHDHPSMRGPGSGSFRMTTAGST